MPTLVQPTMTKGLPKTSAPAKKVSLKDGKVFDDALKDAQPKPSPKPAEAEAKPAGKKLVKPVKARKPENPGPSEEKPAEVSHEANMTAGTAEVELDQQLDATPAEQTPNASPADEKPNAKTNPADDATTAAQIDACPLPVAKVSVEAKDRPADAPTEDASANTGTEVSAIRQPDVRAAKAPAEKPVATATPRELKQPAEKQSAADAVADEAPTDVNVDPETIVAFAKVADEGNTDEQPAEAPTEDAIDPHAAAAHAPAKPVQAKIEQPASVELGAAPAQQTVKVEPQTDSQTEDDASASPQTAAAEIIPEKSDSTDDAASPAPLHPETLLASDVQPKAPAAQAAAPARPTPPPPPPEIRFAEANHPQIVTGIRGQLLPAGGTIHIRLDPPELGALQVSIHMQDGVMTASFQTSNDDATKLLSHSLAQLKHVLESQGVSVDKLHVSQAPRDQQSSNEDNRQQPGGENPQARQEQQRREIIQRMWRRLRDGGDPLDMVA